MRREIWDQNHQELRRRLKEIRLQGGLSQIQLAELLSTTQAFISKYERGERSLDFIEVLQICDACGFSPELLIKEFELK